MGRIRQLLSQPPQKRRLSIEEVTDYVNANRIPAREGRKCIDGRYRPDQGTGMIARPGGDGGYVMALEAVNRKKKLGLTPEECFNAVYKVVAKNGGKFYLHTDKHTDPEDGVHHGLIGCGHIAKAGRRLFSHEYDVRSRDILRMVEYARNLSEISKGIEIVNLSGKHDEMGVLIVDNEKYTVGSSDPKRHEMYFIYDKLRDEAFMKKLAQQINIDGVTFADLKHESDLQIEATMQNLAVGHPIFSVAFSTSGKPAVEFVLRVHQKPILERLHLQLPPLPLINSK